MTKLRRKKVQRVLRNPFLFSAFSLILLLGTVYSFAQTTVRLGKIIFEIKPDQVGTALKTVVSGPGLSTELGWPGSPTSDYACVVRNPYAQPSIRDGFVLSDTNFVVLEEPAELKQSAFSRFPFFTGRPATVGLLVGHAAANGGSVQRLLLADVETGKHLLVLMQDGRLPTWLQQTNRLITSARLETFRDTFRQLAVTNRMGWAAWKAQPGDSLHSIAWKFGVERRRIQAANPKMQWQNLQPGDAVLIPGYGWSLSRGTNFNVMATHKQLGLRIALVNENVDANSNPGEKGGNVSSGSALALLSWQKERYNMWSLTYVAGAPGKFPTFEVIRKLLINVRTREVLADEVCRYETQNNGFLPAAPKWTWTDTACVIRDPLVRDGYPLTVPISAMR